MPKVPGQMGPCYSLSDDATCAAALDAILEKPGAGELVEELHRRLRRRKAPVTESPIYLKSVVLMGRKSILNGLRDAIESGIADNYTFHFAATALAYAMELGRLDPDYFELELFKQDGYQDKLQKYIDELVEEVKGDWIPKPREYIKT